MFLIPISAVADKYPWLLHDGKCAAAVDPRNAEPVLRTLKKHALQLESILGACRAWVAESENRPQRGQFLPDLQAHSPAMGQKSGGKWIAAVDFQPPIPEPDRLLITRHHHADHTLDASVRDDITAFAAIQQWKNQ